MTEDEAKTKWCPYTRVGSSLSGNGSINRDYALGTIDQSFCIGSACMAWRWKDKTLGHELKYHAEREASLNAALQAHEAFLNKNPLNGFCGLAGKP